MRRRKIVLDTVGLRLRHFRVQELGDMSQNKFAQSIDIDPSYYSRIERDEAGLAPDKAVNIATTYHVNLNWLLLGTGEVYRPQAMNVTEATRAFVAGLFSGSRARPEDVQEAADILAFLDAYSKKKSEVKNNFSVENATKNATKPPYNN